jgi:hypothetical protein
MCFERISEQTVTFALHDVNEPVFMTDLESVYCAVRNGSLTKQTAVCPSRVILYFCHPVLFVFYS